MSINENVYRKAVDKQGREYYYNKITRESTWTLPPGASVKERRRSDRNSIGDAFGFSQPLKPVRSESVHEMGNIQTSECKEEVNTVDVIESSIPVHEVPSENIIVPSENEFEFKNVSSTDDTADPEREAAIEEVKRISMIMTPVRRPRKDSVIFTAMSFSPLADEPVVDVNNPKNLNRNLSSSDIFKTMTRNRSVSGSSLASGVPPQSNLTSGVSSRNPSVDLNVIDENTNPNTNNPVPLLTNTNRNSSNVRSERQNNSITTPILMSIKTPLFKAQAPPNINLSTPSVYVGHGMLSTMHATPRHVESTPLRFGQTPMFQSVLTPLFSDGYTPGRSDSGNKKSSLWVESREVDSGRYFWYHSKTFQLVFDFNPNLSSDSDKFNSGQTGKGFDPLNDPNWERNNDGSWYNKETFETCDTPVYTSVETVDSNREITVSKTEIHSILEHTDENPASAAIQLLDIDATGWNFDNARVDLFRARACKINHESFAPDSESLMFPRYFSTEPIMSVNMFQMSVKIPEEFGNAKATRVLVKPSETGIEVIERVLRKCVDGLVSNDFVLKVNGREEYIYGEPKVIDYEFIRYTLRNSGDISLFLMKRSSSPNLTFPTEWLAPALYEEKYMHAGILTENMYNGLSFVAKSSDPAEWTLIPLSELNRPFRVQIKEISNISNLPRYNTQFIDITVKMVLYHGATQLKSSLVCTNSNFFVSEPTFYQWLVPPSNVMFNQLPRETRICFLVYGVNQDKSQILLGYVSQNLVDECGCLITGSKCLKLWSVDGKVAVDPNKKGKYLSGSKDDIFAFLPQAPSWENNSYSACASLAIHFDDFELPVVAPIFPPPVHINEKHVGFKLNHTMLSKSTLQKLDSVAKSDPLKEFSDEERDLMWIYRHMYVKMPSVLSKFLQCVDWTDLQCQAEAHRLLKEWAPLNPLQALELLDPRFPDTTVRRYAVNCLSTISDSELADLLLQLVQIIKYEQHHDSYLVRFLVERCLRNPYQLGHYFFWHLKAELHSIDFVERYYVILEEFLKHSKHHAVELHIQNILILRLQEIAEMIIEMKKDDKFSDDVCRAKLREELTKLNFRLPSRFQVSLNPRWLAKRIKPEACTFFSSKKKPIKLVFENVDPNGADIVVIFKSGDDLRQDILTLQLLKMMDNIWLSEGLDLRMKPYAVIATGVNKEGEGVGMIEAVLKSNTLADAQYKYGGGAVGAVKDSPLSDYIRDHNSPGVKLETAISNFRRSCAGYCVATAVLGIGDRHNGNIMLTESGHLFHIDFGHFLGNFKKKFGISRERSPFVFTPQMAYVFGGDNYIKSPGYSEFVKLCCDAYNALRKKSSLLISMFILMQSAGMPELSCLEDIHYLRNMLQLDMSDQESAVFFRDEIDSSVKGKFKLLDNFFHIWRHKKFL